MINARSWNEVKSGEMCIGGCKDFSQPAVNILTTYFYNLYILTFGYVLVIEYLAISVCCVMHCGPSFL